MSDMLPPGSDVCVFMQRAFSLVCDMPMAELSLSPTQADLQVCGTGGPAQACQRGVEVCLQRCHQHRCPVPGGPECSLSVRCLSPSRPCSCSGHCQNDLTLGHTGHMYCRSLRAC